MMRMRIAAGVLRMDHPVSTGRDPQRDHDAANHRESHHFHLRFWTKHRFYMIAGSIADMFDTGYGRTEVIAVAKLQQVTVKTAPPTVIFRFVATTHAQMWPRLT